MGRTLRIPQFLRIDRREISNDRFTVLGKEVFWCKDSCMEA